MSHPERGHEFDPHIYVGPGYSDAAFRRNVLPYVERHDMAIVVNDYASDPEKAGEEVRDRLREAHERGVDVWLGAGTLPHEDDVDDPSLAATDEDLLADDERMETFREAHRRVADTYAEFYPEGRVILWHEMPYMGNWAGETYEEKAESVVENGPAVFEAQKEAVGEAAPGLDVGIFPHWPAVPDERHTEVPVLQRLLGRMQEAGTLPDFTYFDYYRGYYEWSAGYEPSNDWLEAAVANVKEHTDDRPVYCLCEAHTINNLYTPSKQAIAGNVSAALESGVDGLGWYYRSAYRQTRDRNYNPFVPNRGEVNEDQFTSLTGSRDRLQYAAMRMLECHHEFDPAGKFDLWVYGHDFDFYENAVSLRRDGDWEFVGDVSGYVDGDNPYSGGGRRRACVFHALDRTFLDGDLEVRVEGSEDGDGATLEAVAAVPYVPTGLYQTELDATDWFRRGEVGAFALGTWHDELAVGSGEAVTATVETGDPDRSLVETVYPEQGDAYQRILDLAPLGEAREHFDLWVYGRDLAGLRATAEETDLAEYRHPAAPGRSEAGREAVAYRGLEREEFLGRSAGGRYLDVEFDAEDGATVLGAYAMPCGAATFETDDAIAAILDREYEETAGQVGTFALGHATWPEGKRVGPGDPLEAWVHVSNRRAVSRAE